MIKYSKTLIFQLIYLAVFYFIIYEFENFEIAMVVFFLPFLASSIMTYRKFEKITESSKYVMLSKSNFNYWNFVFIALLIFFCLKELTIYTGILLLFGLTFLFLEYSVSKRRVITISENGIDEIGENKHRELSEITSLNIYPNNVELRFNETEILQINKNELVQPKWNDFLENIAEIKTYANTGYKP